MKKVKKKPLSIPPIPVGHLTIKQFEELRGHIKRFTGTRVVLEIFDAQKKKVTTL